MGTIVYRTIAQALAEFVNLKKLNFFGYIFATLFSTSPYIHVYERGRGREGERERGGEGEGEGEGERERGRGRGRGGEGERGRGSSPNRDSFQLADHSTLQ